MHAPDIRNAALAGDESVAPGNEKATRDNRVALSQLDAGLRLIELGLPIIPVGRGKTPEDVIRWRNGSQDYVTDRMTSEQWSGWASKSNVHGVAVVGSEVYRTVIFDIETPGMSEPMIQAALQLLPGSCQQSTLSGGRHAYVIVEDDYPTFGPGEHKLAQHPPREGETEAILLAEVRAHKQYAVIVGPGRPPLPEDFEPARISRAEFDKVRAMIAEAGTFTPKKRERTPYAAGDGSGGGTGSIISDAVAQGSLSPLAVLPDGWEVVGSDQEGRTYIKRPGGTSETSGNVLRSSVVIHSTSVDWTEPGESITPAECLARSRFGGNFRSAMQWVEQMALDLVDEGTVPEDQSWADAGDVLEAVRRTLPSGLPEYGGASATAPPLPDVPTITVENAKATFRHWLGDSYDTDAMLACASIAACLHLDGDTPWLLVVSGSGFTKTETVSALAGMGAHITSTITSEGALLSATSRRERTRNATGGLLRTVGEAGVLVIKDVTSILSMGRELRASVLAALREVADGYWERNVGTDGGQTLTWEGRCITVGAVTTSWDKHYQVVAEMGDRFLLVRMDSNNADSRDSAGRQSLRMTSREKNMRAELRAAVAGLLAGMDRHREDDPTEVEETLLVEVADLVARCRTAVERDYQGKPEWAHALEAPTRLAKYLWQMVRGALAIGVGREEALRLAVRVAGDSMPQVRLDVLLMVQEVPDQTSWQYAKLLQLPRTTVDRTLQELHLLGAVEVAVSEEVSTKADGTEKRDPWRYSISEQIDENVLDLLGNRKKERPEKSVGPQPHIDSECQGGSEKGSLRPPTDTTGRSRYASLTHTATDCSGCGGPLDPIHYRLGHHPVVCAPSQEQPF